MKFMYYLCMFAGVLCTTGLIKEMLAGDYIMALLSFILAVINLSNAKKFFFLLKEEGK
jgi:hypothetical protein